MKNLYHKVYQMRQVWKPYCIIMLPFLKFLKLLLGKHGLNPIRPRVFDALGSLGLGLGSP